MSNRSGGKPVTQQQKPQISVQQTKASFYQGIIPHAEQLQQYEQISPGFADRIIRLTEDEGNHRRKIENRVVNTNIVIGFTSQFFAFAGVLVIGFLCYFCIDKGYATQAASIAVGVMATLAIAFLRPKK